MNKFFMHPCTVCSSKDAPFGFNDKYFCRDHRAEGEMLLAATQDSLSVPAQDPPPRSVEPVKQGKLL